MPRNIIVVTFVVFLCIRYSSLHQKKLTNWVKLEKGLELGCEGEEVNIACPNYEGIRILNAFWGRDDVTTCQPDDPLEPKSYKDMCKPVDKEYAKRKVKEMCHGIEICRVPATVTFFDTEPCPNVIKYLRVNYECRHMSGMKKKKSFIEILRRR